MTTIHFTAFLYIYTHYRWSTTSFSTGGAEESTYYDYYGYKVESEVDQGCPQGNNQQNDNNQQNNYYDANGQQVYYQDNNNNDQYNQNNNNQNDDGGNQNDNNQNDQNQNNNQNQNDQNQDNRRRKKNRFLEDGGDGGQACGNKSNSCDQWWQGMGSCYGANVAYSLYGILPGDAASTFNPCNRGTFINSFFTKDGLQSFVKASKGKIDISSLDEQCNGGTSTSCSADGTFEVASFNGGCFPSNYVATVDTLDSLNKALESDMNCVLIYSSGGTNYASDILSQSQQCSFDMASCPDPYGLVGKYEFNFAMAQRYSKYKAPDVKTEKILDALSALVFTGAGVALLLHRYRPNGSSQEPEETNLVMNNYMVSA
jgi:hypothetical protein